MATALGTLFELASEGSQSALFDLTEAAAASEPGAMFLLGRLFDIRRDASVVETDLVKARSWYEQAASFGYAPAEFAMGNMFEFGEGAPKDEVVARHWYYLAATHGNVEAQMSFARMLQTGRGGAQSTLEAALWYREAANRGHELAATNLALMHYGKDILDASDGVAFTLFGIAADKLDGLAHLMLAEMWFEGRGTARNGDHALLHYCIACVLLPTGTNLGRATRFKEMMLEKYPELRSDFESQAEEYISARNQGHMVACRG